MAFYTIFSFFCAVLNITITILSWKMIFTNFKPKIQKNTFNFPPTNQLFKTHLDQLWKQIGYWLLKRELFFYLGL